ncbi:MAG: hypothetical protein AB4290_28650 [Spirulina sp.]
MVDELHSEFDLVLWRSLDNLPSIREFLAELPEIKYCVGDNSPKRMLRLQGLTVENGKTLCNTGKTLQATQTEWENLIRYYGGHPLFLKMVATTIHNLFNGNVAEFLHSNINLYGGIGQHLDRQFQALSTREQQLLCHLARQSDRITFKDIRESPTLMPLQALVEAFEGLEGRSFIQKQEDYFILQPAIRYYAIAQCKAIEPSGQVSAS